MDDTIRIWDVSAWRRRGQSLRGHEDRVRSVSFSTNGTKLASGSDDGTIRLWDVESGHCLGISPRISSWIISMSFACSGKRIVSASPDGKVRIWDACLREESRDRSRGHSGPVRDVSICQNGSLVASASEDRTVRLWDSQTGEQVGEPLKGHTGVVTSVSFSPDGRKLVSGSSDCNLRLWDAETYTQIGGPFEGHTNGIRCVSFSWDGLRVISGSNDFTVRLWNAATHEQIGYVVEAEAAHLISYVSESFDGCHFVSRDVSRRTTIRNFETMAVLWTSKTLESGSESDSQGEPESHIENVIREDEATAIIRSCGYRTSRLWPRCFPPYTGELY